MFSARQAVLGALAAASLGFAAYTVNEVHERKATEQQLRDELNALRKHSEDIEQALIDAEQQASYARRQQDRGRPAAPPPPAIVAAPAPAPFARAASQSKPVFNPRPERPEAARRKASEQRAQQEARERRRAEEAALANAPAPAPPPPAPPPAPVQVARATPEQVCRAASNFIARAICETRECVKEENVNTEYCKSLRARATHPQSP